jgi:hypothetical protein
MRWRLSKLDFPYLLGELAIVVIGVLIALGVDRWNGEQDDEALERQYLARLSEDLASGESSLEGFLARVDRVIGAQALLIESLNDSESEKNWDSLVDEFIWASRQRGGSDIVDSRLRHDLAYQELINTGRLALIQEVDVRDAISEYYQTLAIAVDLNAYTPNDASVRFSRITGHTAGDFLREGDRVDLTEAIREALVAELEEAPGAISGELAETKAALGIVSRWTNIALESNRALQSTVSEESR